MYHIFYNLLQIFIHRTKHYPNDILMMIISSVPDEQKKGVWNFQTP